MLDKQACAFQLAVCYLAQFGNHQIPSNCLPDTCRKRVTGQTEMAAITAMHTSMARLRIKSCYCCIVLVPISLLWDFHYLRKRLQYCCNITAKHLIRSCHISDCARHKFWLPYFRLRSSQVLVIKSIHFIPI